MSMPATASYSAVRAGKERAKTILVLAEILADANKHGNPHPKALGPP